MRKYLLILTLQLTLTPGLQSVRAQELASAQPDSAPLLFHPLPMDTTAFDHPSFRNRILTGLAGAALGAGIGFFASHLAQGDWDEGGSRPPVNRSAWAAVGGAGGLVLGFSLPIAGQAPGATSSFPGTDRFIITGDQIREASLANAREAVEYFHPEWLRQQRPDSFEEFRVFTAADIPVYLDNARLEGINDLAGINALVIKSIQFLNTQQATVRWGTGHSFGAIQVLTQD